MAGRKRAWGASVRANPASHPMVTAPAIEMNRPSRAEVDSLRTALQMSDRAGTNVVMSHRDTSFVPDGISVDEYEREVDAQVIDSVKSTPTHY